MATVAPGLQPSTVPGISLALGQTSGQKGPQSSLLSAPISLPTQTPSSVSGLAGSTLTTQGASQVGGSIGIKGLTANLGGVTTAGGPMKGLGITATPSTTQPTTTYTQPGLGLSGTKGLGTQPPGASSKSKQYTYRQLQELVTNWTSELEENEKLFLKQAQQMSEWDKTLTDNAEGIISIHSDLDIVKTEQNKLEKELDLILAQQKDIEELLVPLEDKARYHQPSSQQKADIERDRIYNLAESLDQQMQQMEQSLAEIIEHINTASSERDPHTPIAQIAKILNAHASSLQWIERNAGILSNQLERIG